MPAPARQLSVRSCTISRAPSWSHSGRCANSNTTVAMQPSSMLPVVSSVPPSCTQVTDQSMKSQPASVVFARDLQFGGHTGYCDDLRGLSSPSAWPSIRAHSNLHLGSPPHFRKAFIFMVWICSTNANRRRRQTQCCQREASQGLTPCTTAPASAQVSA